MVNPVTLTMPPSGRTVFRVSEIFGRGIFGSIGWVEISSSTPAVQGSLLVFDAKTKALFGSDRLTLPSNRLIFPRVSSGDQFGTRLSLVNAGSVPITGSFSLYEANGRLAATREFALAEFSGFSGAIDELAPSLGGLDGYLVVQADDSLPETPGRLIGAEIYRNGSGAALIGAFPGSAALKQGHLAYFATQAGSTATLTLINPSNQPQRSRITLGQLQVGDEPVAVSSITVDRTLPPNALLQERVEDVFGLSKDVLSTGHIVIETDGDGPGVIGFLDCGPVDGSIVAFIEAQDQQYFDLSFPRLTAPDNTYSGLALLNPNDAPGQVRVELVDDAGQPTSSAVPILKAGERRAGLLSEFLKDVADGNGGYVHIATNFPVFALELLGSSEPEVFS